MKLTTEQKVRIARVLAKTLVGGRRLVGLGPDVVVTRGDISWHLDLREGIDLAVFLRVYERQQRRALARLLRPGGTAVDVGANIGVYTLAFASALGEEGRVLAFEPTAFAFSKLQRNLCLNPKLASRVETFQAFLVGASGSSELPASVYSSWPVVETRDATHPTLMGRRMGTEGAFKISLDELVETLANEGVGLSRLDLMKIDVDGNELDVVEGSVKTIERFSPAILLEFAPHLHADVHTWASSWVNTLNELDYELRHPSDLTAIELTIDVLSEIASFGASTDLLAVRKSTG